MFGAAHVKFTGGKKEWSAAAAGFSCFTKSVQSELPLRRLHPALLFGTCCFESDELVLSSWKVVLNIEKIVPEP